MKKHKTAVKGSTATKPAARKRPVSPEGKQNRGPKPGKATYMESRAKREIADADLMEMKLAKRQGELVEAGQVLEDWRAMVGMVRARLQATARELGPVLAKETDPHTAHQLMEAALEHALTVLSEEQPEQQPEGGNRGRAKREAA